MTYLPNKGVTAREVNPDRVHETFQLRELLEAFSTRIATPRLTKEDLKLLSALQQDMRASRKAEDMTTLTATNDQWHMIIHRAAGSELLRQMIATLWRASPWDTLWAIHDRPVAAVREHQRILEALRAPPIGGRTRDGRTYQKRRADAPQISRDLEGTRWR